MKLIRNLDNFTLDNTIITLGKFDGSHLGHRLLFDTAVKSKKDGMKAVIFTFDIHPEKMISSSDTKTIQTNEEKENSQFPEGIDYVIEYPFDKETMEMSPEDFVSKILVGKLGVKLIVVGKDFHFGYKRSGNVETLSELGVKYGFQVNALDKVTYKTSDSEIPQEISSSLIKEEILKGNFEDVTNMLGRPFCISGEIIHGKHLGTGIGFPTINMSVPEGKILPPYGVYATRTLINGKDYISITNIGRRPTFDDGEHPNVETNIFDFNEDAYGQIAEVSFYKMIRPERKFSGIDELKEEISRNSIEVKEFFNNYENTK